ncbi:MAG: helix-turn-helix domain-containing protein [Roseburia sp.]|nr:helix-turn-helix domain-containing protein [Roseburia sp.]
MTLGEKIYRLRSEQGLSQEAFGDSLGVSRQSVSKWETDQSQPELEKIIAISNLFGVSTDYLLKDGMDSASGAGRENVKNDAGGESGLDTEDTYEKSAYPLYIRTIKPRYEYKSKKIIKGLPLVHVTFGMGRPARGIIAVGIRAKGVVSIGILSMGIFSIGILSLGVLAFGTVALGLVAMGSFALGIIALGAVSLGIFCMGALNIGEFCFGALSYGRQVAIGDEAHGKIAIGFSRAMGTVYEEVIGKDYQFDPATVEKVIDENVSSNWLFFRSWIKGILRMLAK